MIFNCEEVSIVCHFYTSVEAVFERAENFQKILRHELVFKNLRESDVG